MEKRFFVWSERTWMQKLAKEDALQAAKLAANREGGEVLVLEAITSIRPRLDVDVTDLRGQTEQS